MAKQMKTAMGAYFGVVAGFALLSVAPLQAKVTTTEPQPPIVVFRWYDAQGYPHDTTDANTIPPGAKRELRGMPYPSNDVQKRRSWWRARKSRLVAELHAAEDARQAAEAALAAAVKDGMPVGEREPLRQNVQERKAEEQRLRLELERFQEEAQKKKVPQRWLR